MGAGYAAGEITRGHVGVCVGVHGALPAAVRNAPTPVLDPVSGQRTEVRCIAAVDAVLADQARVLTVPELAAAADRLVQHLSPPAPVGADRRRYLTFTRFLTGRWSAGSAAVRRRRSC